MKKENGFTLIELLAVIVILAVIALIATPLVMNTIEDAKDGSFKSTARNIIEIAETEYQKKLIDDPNTIPSIDFSALEYKGEKVDGISGSFNDNGTANIAIIKGDKCIYRKSGDIDVTLVKVTNMAECEEYKNGTHSGGSGGTTPDVTALQVHIDGCEVAGNCEMTIVPTSYYNLPDAVVKGEGDVIVDAPITKSGNFDPSVENDYVVTYDASTETGKGSSKLTIHVKYEPTSEDCFTTSGNTITSYKCYVGNPYSLPEIRDIVIPKEIKGVKITAFGDEIFYWDQNNNFADIYNQLDSIKMTDNITSIGTGIRESTLQFVQLSNNITIIPWGAFMDNWNLTTISLPKNLKKLEMNAFMGSGLESINLPNGLETIDNQAFSLTPLRKVTLPGAIKELGFSIFLDCDKIEEVIIEEGIKVIPEATFGENKSLKKLVLPESLEEIQSFAFTQNQIETLVFPSGLKKLGNQVFDSVYTPSLKKVTIKGKTKVSDFLDSEGKAMTSFEDHSIFSWADGYDENNIIWGN